MRKVALVCMREIRRNRRKGLKLSAYLTAMSAILSRKALSLALRGPPFTDKADDIS